MISDSGSDSPKKPQDFKLNSFAVDLNTNTVTPSVVPCEDFEDALGGCARGFKLLEDHAVDDPYVPEARLIMNLGILSGTDYMTGLRTYFNAYSPLKRSRIGKPSAMWSTGSGKFGTKLRYLGIDEVVFTGRCDKPTVLRLYKDDADGPVKFEFLDGAEYSGLWVNDRILKLYENYPDAHFAVIGPSGENYENCYYAAIALSTENQLKTKDNKPRFAGRGGMGGVMGSKNLMAIVADIKDVVGPKGPDIVKQINIEIAKGKGSSRFRDKKKDGGGGTWANVEVLNPVGCMPEMNFVPTGTRVSLPFHRDNFEATGEYVVKDESCFRCGISCHKNIYDADENGKAAQFRAKWDYEPLNLLSSNIGIFDGHECLELCEYVDQMCMDSISIGTTLSWAMEYNRRNPDTPVAGGMAYGDFEATAQVVQDIGNGKLGDLGRGVALIARERNAEGYAMHSKGMEYAAYLPQHNPGYPWALAGAHMSMKTYLLCVNEKETSMDYWVDAITSPKRGLSILRDDFTGVCKFSALKNDMMVDALGAIGGLEITEAELENMVRRVFLRGYALELKQGFTDEDYVMPDEVHDEYPQIELPYFNTREFFGELKTRVQKRFSEMLVEEGLN